MSRRTLILCLTALAVLLFGLGIAIAVLYSGTGNNKGKHEFDGDRACLAAVPSDALLVSCFESVSDACEGVLSGYAFPAFLAQKVEDGSMASLRRCSMAVSLHYVGRLHSLYVIDVDKASEGTLDNLTACLKEKGLSFSRTGDFLSISSSETLVRSSSRHFEKNVSIADASGFEDAISTVEGEDVLVISNLHAQKLMSSVLSGSIARQYPFVERIGEWMAFDISSEDDRPAFLEGTMLYDGDPDEFLTVLGGCSPAVSQVAEVLPKYTFSYVTLPLRDMDDYVSSYKSFIDSRQGLQTMKARQNNLAKSAGISPEDLVKLLDIKELTSATFMAGSTLEKVNLIHSGCKDAALVFKGNEGVSFKESSDAVLTWAYPSFMASVFGQMFSLKDETNFTYVDGWIITGSRKAIEEYVKNGALEYTLKDYLSDAGRTSLLSDEPVLATAYFSATEDEDLLSTYLKPDIRKFLTKMTGDCDYAPAVFSLTKDKKDVLASFAIHTLSMKQIKSPTHDRDTVVTVPSGPFQVKNSGTGKMNTFYQNKHNAICLRDENGKDLWGVPFDHKICGTAHNVDYYANGKLQIIFGAGTKIYLIDRLGRYVKGFPIDLGQKIVLGPDVYDFSGARKYNIMVLHDDKTIQMYNLKGKRPDAWKGIKADETIKALPERLTISGKDFWIVRTSIQTLIFPFYGGDPLTTFEGDSRLKPDTEVVKTEGGSVQATSYDGRTRTIKLIK